ncbi:MarR family transcriptional regulator [Marinomonas sp. THO17]|uniref:MarR family winged helix-turn-helix transcriptional regulator n=1 Tax=Marinomonas sp. THO17 TaxID=3149048 RepID=UPI00336BCF1E
MPSFEEELQLIFIHSINALKESMWDTMKSLELELTPVSFMALKIIHQQKMCTAHTISTTTGKDKGQVTRIVKDLLAQQLIEKQAHPMDKRSQILTLTEQGKSIFIQLQKADLAALNAMKTGLSDEQITNFMSIGRTMVNNIQQHNVNRKN